MTDRGQLVVVEFDAADVPALDSAAEVFNVSRAELVRDIATIFARGCAMIGPPPRGTEIGQLFFCGEWRRGQ